MTKSEKGSKDVHGKRGRKERGVEGRKGGRKETGIERIHPTPPLRSGLVKPFIDAPRHI